MRKLTVRVVIGLLAMSFVIASLAPLAKAATTNYTVQPGDSLWKVARKFNTSINNLKSLNKNWANQVYVGQKLQVPVANDSGWVYYVKRDDSIWKVAKKVGLSVNTLMQANGMWSSYLQVGQKLWIPTYVSSNVSTNASVGLSDSDVTLLARVIHAEAGGESFNGQVAVGSVLLNRVKSPKFPNTLREVVFQQHAFETVSNGRIWLTPNEAAYSAARAALSGWDPTGGALYFFNPAKVYNPNSWIWTRQISLRIGQHVFAF